MILDNMPVIISPMLYVQTIAVLSIKYRIMVMADNTRGESLNLFINL